MIAVSGARYRTREGEKAHRVVPAEQCARFENGHLVERSAVDAA
ncbi:hypothetical protein [Kribbella sp. NBC_00889]|nr:hypothetical protein OG817_25240 [Kribbella sp. NBC_00889]